MTASHQPPRSDLILRSSLQCIHHRLGLFKLCGHTKENNYKTMIIPSQRA